MKACWVIGQDGGEVKSLYGNSKSTNSSELNTFVTFSLQTLTAVRENEPPLMIHPPKERLDVCDFFCWFKPIMLPPADIHLAKIVAETESPPLIHRMAKQFRQPGDTGRNSTVGRNTHNVLCDCLL